MATKDGQRSSGDGEVDPGAEKGEITAESQSTPNKRDDKKTLLNSSANSAVPSSSFFFPQQNRTRGTIAAHTTRFAAHPQNDQADTLCLLLRLKAARDWIEESWHEWRDLCAVFGYPKDCEPDALCGRKRRLTGFS
jgi:hypothetical protein